MFGYKTVPANEKFCPFLEFCVLYYYISKQEFLKENNTCHVLNI